MAELLEPSLVVPEGQVRVLVGPMGAGKSEHAGRWLEEGLEVAELDDDVEIPVWLYARQVTSSLSAAVTEAIGGDPRRPCRVVIDDVDSLAPRQADQLLDEARRLVIDGLSAGAGQVVAVLGKSTEGCDGIVDAGGAEPGGGVKAMPTDQRVGSSLVRL